MDDVSFLNHVANRLAALPTVQAVSLGGSRASKAHRPDSDWDFALYYRGSFSPDDLSAVGWKGTVSGVGDWGGGVFNGGAWMEVEGRRVDVHYRDLDVVEYQLDEARHGRFHIEPLMFHLAGIPSYLVVAELAINQVLRGDMPRPEYPRPLQESAPPVWRERARLTLDYARSAYARSGRVAELAGSLATAAMMTAHASLAARGMWVTNEKRLLEHAGLRDIDGLITGLQRDSCTLEAALDEAEIRFAEVLGEPPL